MHLTEIIFICSIDVPASMWSCIITTAYYYSLDSERCIYISEITLCMYISLIFIMIILLAVYFEKTLNSITSMKINGPTNYGTVLWEHSYKSACLHYFGNGKSA